MTLATTITVSASMRTRKTISSSNYKSSAASQEFYTDDYNFVGIVNFPGLNLTNKVITAIKLKVTAAQAGFGAGTTKTVYVRESNYQVASQSGITGANYAGAALGTFTGSFYGNTTTSTLSGTLFTNFANYLTAGNNTICLYNPNASRASGQTYANNFLQWDACQIIVTYEEAASVPTTSPTTVTMGDAVMINTNRLSTAATHTLKYTFGDETGTIATGVGASTSWMPPVSLASQIPNAKSGDCTITCETYYNGVLTGTKTCKLTLTVPSSVVPVIQSITLQESTAGIEGQFGAGSYIQGKSKLSVSISTAKAYGSNIDTYRATLDGVTYTAASFTTAILAFSGTKVLSVTVTDTRGRIATTSVNITVVAYAPPSISAFSAERCNADGSAPQQDGTKVRVNITASVSYCNSKNTKACEVYYKLQSASVWTFAQSVTMAEAPAGAPTSYQAAQTNILLSPTFNALSSYDIKVAVTDFFTTSNPVEQEVSISTKQVMIDLLGNGTGIAFGKIAEVSNVSEFGWPLALAEPLGLSDGGTGATDATGARANIGAAAASHNHGAGEITTGTLPLTRGGTGQTTAAGIRNALGLGNTTGALPIANGGHAGTTLAQAQANLGIAVSSTTTPAVASVLGTIEYFRLYKVGKMVTFNMRYSTGMAAGANTEAAIIPSAYRAIDAYVPLATYYGNNTISIDAYTTNTGILMIRPSANVNNVALSGSWVTA